VTALFLFPHFRICKLFILQGKETSTPLYRAPVSFALVLWRAFCLRAGTLLKNTLFSITPARGNSRSGIPFHPFPTSLFFARKSPRKPFFPLATCTQRSEALEYCPFPEGNESSLLSPRLEDPPPHFRVEELTPKLSHRARGPGRALQVSFPQGKSFPPFCSSRSRPLLC